MEKVGKMVFKMKPSKSGINKLPLFRQFRPACKKLGSSDETFWRTWKFSAKRYMYIFYSTSAREGPLPLPNCFFCYTRPSVRSASHPPSVTNLASEKRKFFVSPLPHLRSVNLAKNPTWNVRIHITPYGRNGEAHFFFSLNFSEQFT